jgi:hypothetical protein
MSMSRRWRRWRCCRRWRLSKWLLNNRLYLNNCAVRPLEDILVEILDNTMCVGGRMRVRLKV